MSESKIDAAPKVQASNAGRWVRGILLALWTAMVGLAGYKAGENHVYQAEMDKPISDIIQGK